MSEKIFKLTKEEKEKLAERFDEICDLLKKNYSCKDCPFNNPDENFITEINFECKLDKVIEDVYKNSEE